MRLGQVAQFDLPKNHAICVATLLIFGYVGVTLAENEMFSWQMEYKGVVLKDNCLEYGKDPKRNLCGDYLLREKYLAEWQPEWLYNDFRHGIVLSLLVLSRELFGEPRVLAFVSSVMFLVLTLFLGKTISNRRFVGLVAMGFVLLSSIFNKYDTGITYPTFWGTFYLASIYAMFKVPRIAFLGYLFALCFKNIALLYLPASIVFAKFSSVKHKKIIYLTHFAVLAGGLGYLMYDAQVLEGVSTQIQFNLEDFIWWLGMWAVEFNDDKVTLFVMFFVVGGLWILKRQNVANSFAVLMMIVVILLQPSFIAGFTLYTNEDYRFLVLVAFVGIGIGMIISNLDKLAFGIQRPSS